MLVDIHNAEVTKTQELLGLILIQLNQDNRVRFYVSRGKGGPTVQCLRVMLSRVRQTMKDKGKLRKHFRLHSEVFPWTGLKGERFDCIIMWRTRGVNQEVMETLEDLMSNDTA